MKASELLVELQKIVDSGHGDKHLYVDDEIIISDIHLISAIEHNDVGIEVRTQYSNMGALIDEM